MTTFDKRKNEEEARYKRDEELKFKITARRNRLLGLWAAEQLGIQGAAAEAYAKGVVAADFDRPGDSDVVEKVLKDFAVKNIAMDEHRLRKEMTRLTEVARRQIMSE